MSSVLSVRESVPSVGDLLSIPATGCNHIITDDDLTLGFGWPPVPEPDHPREQLSAPGAPCGSIKEPDDREPLWVGCCSVELNGHLPLIACRCHPSRWKQCPQRLQLETVSWAE